MPSRFGQKKNTPQGVSYKNVIQLYSRLISVNPRNHESSSNFPLSESRSHSITVLPLPVSALIRSPVRSISELIRLQVRADTAAHARSIPSDPFRQAWPFNASMSSRTFTSIKQSLLYISGHSPPVGDIGSPPFYG